MIHEPGVPNFDHQEPGCSTSECLVRVPKERCPKSNYQKPGGSTSDLLMLVTCALRIRLRRHSLIILTEQISR